MQPETIETRIPSVLEDPSIASIARVYSQALLDATGDQSEAVLEEFESFLKDVLDPNPKAERLLSSAMIPAEDKETFLKNAFGSVISPSFGNFLQVVAGHGRLNLLRPIYDAARILFETRSGKRRVRVTLASEPTEELRQQIQNHLQSQLPFQPEITYVIDESIIGGMILRIKDTVYDSSLRSRLARIKDQVRQRYLYEIQSGRDRFSTPEGN